MSVPESVWFRNAWAKRRPLLNRAWKYRLPHPSAWAAPIPVSSMLFTAVLTPPLKTSSASPAKRKSMRASADQRALRKSRSTVEGSSGSVYSKSLPRKYWAETLKPKAPSAREWAVRSWPWKTERSPPATEKDEPGRSIGDAVMMCMTPDAALGP